MASYTDDSTDIFLADASLERIENLRNLTDTPVVWESDVSWTPDATGLVFTRASFTFGPLTLVIGLDGSPLGRLLPSAEELSPSYVRLSPDMTRLAFLAPAALDLLLYVADFDGTSTVPLTETGFVGGAPSFSPDGHLLAYCWLPEATSHTGQLVVASLDSPTSRIVVTMDAEGCSGPSWSPDGEWIAFAVSRDHSYGLDIIRPDGTDRLSVDTGQGSAGYPNWRHIPYQP